MESLLFEIDPKSLFLFLTLPWVILALLSVLCDAGVGYIDEMLLKKLDTHRKVEINAPTQLLLISGIFGLLISLIVLILVSTTSLYLDLSLRSFLYAFTAGLLEVLWMVPYFYALHRSSALNATPLFQTIPIFALIFGLLFFSEIPSSTQITAVGFILLGGFLLNYSPDLKKLDKHTVILMFISSAIISAGYFIFKDAAEISNFPTALFGNGIGMGFLSGVIWFTSKKCRRQFIKQLITLDRKVLFIQAGNESLYAVSTVLNQFAIVLGPSVVLVSSIGALHPLFTLIIGAILAKFGYSNYADSLSGGGKILKITAIILITTGAFIFMSSY